LCRAGLDLICFLLDEQLDAIDKHKAKKDGKHPSHLWILGKTKLNNNRYAAEKHAQELLASGY
jgi:hypothetical protein